MTGVGLVIVVVFWALLLATTAFAVVVFIEDYRAYSRRVDEVGDERVVD